MAKEQISLKRIGIDKTNGRIVAVTAASSFLVVFFLVGSFSLFGQLTYQNRVIAVKKKAVSQLKANLTARDSVVESYKAFVGAPQNLIGGNPNGSGPRDGSNAKLVLDSLPSKYDFPALTTSVERILLDRQLKVKNITGVDDEVNQVAEASGNPVPIEMPIEFEAGGTYVTVQKTIEDMERSIRPMQVISMRVNGEQQDLALTVAAKTFYQPEKSLNIKMETVK